MTAGFVKQSATVKKRVIPGSLFIPPSKMCSSMCRHEDKHCPRCGIAFECKPGSINQCQCYGITLNNEEQQYISEQFTDCLCIICIKTLRTEYNIEKFATQIKKHPGH